MKPVLPSIFLFRSEVPSIFDSWKLVLILASILDLQVNYNVSLVLLVVVLKARD